MSESQIQHSIVDFLRGVGALVVVTSQDRRTRKQLASVPDVIAFYRGNTLCIETKAKDGELSEGQKAWRDALFRHMTGDHLHYLVPRSLDDVVRYGMLQGWWVWGV